MSTNPSTAAAATPRWDAKRLGWPRPRLGIAAVALLVAIVFPFVSPDRSWLSTAALVMITITLAQSWNLVLGYGGVWNFGQLAFYALGAYSAGIIATYLPVSPWVAIPIGGIVSAVIALLLSIPVLRLRGIYVSLLTFGFAEVVRLLIIADQSGVTGGSYGMSGFTGFGFSGENALKINYWIGLGVALLTTLVLFALVRSPLGNGMIAMRDNPALASARGVGQRTYQMVIFAISGFFAGVAGAVYANVFEVASPTLMGLGPMTLIVTMMVVGGLGTITGPIIGTILISFVQMQLQDVPEVRFVALGIVLLIVILAMPRGLVPFISGLWARFEFWMNEDQDWTDDDYEDEPEPETRSSRRAQTEAPKAERTASR
ncbi:branched-chain amino acid ABC transporter permease [Leucobacter sp. USHLN153]|uniref:branched-chain amino acid ABC transporter permease n=1 Tax=Leucobacter sp. USHLN153 TaxID=3081268 RepID=UPI003018A118